MDKHRLETERQTSEDQITTGFRIVAELFERLLTQAKQVLDLRHSEAIVNVATFQAALVHMQGQISQIEEQRFGIQEMHNAGHEQ